MVATFGWKEELRVVGWLTVCRCTFAHFLIAPIASLIALSIAHGILARVLPATVPIEDCE